MLATAVAERNERRVNADNCFNDKFDDYVARIEKWEKAQARKIARKQKSEDFVKMITKRLLATLAGLLVFIVLLHIV